MKGAAKKLDSHLAVDGGRPVRSTLLPYGKQWIEAEDVKAVTEVLNSAWLTTGPKVSEFEQAMCRWIGSRFAVAVSNGTAALHAAMHAAGIGPGDEVLVTTMTFAASANAVLYVGATPIFVDVDPRTLLIDPKDVDKKITSKTKAVVAVDYAGQPCDYDALKTLCQARCLVLIADACHSLGASYHSRPVGTLADLTVFSFHPVKTITTGEGGMIVGDRSDYEKRMRTFRSHGITTDLHQREKKNVWYYEMTDLGFNYRITDLQCALGISQLGRLETMLERRRQIAMQYDKAFRPMDLLKPLESAPKIQHAHHLYIIQLELEKLTASRDEIYTALRAEGVGVNVHYIPVHLHPYYRNRFKTGPGLCPVAERAFERLITLPLFPTMKEQDTEDVIEAVSKVLNAYRK